MRKLRYRFSSDEALMLAYRDGDSGAFECLYHRHKDALFTFLYRGCGQPNVVEEVAQETWEAVINAASRYTPSAKFRTWLFQIGRRRMADHWRRVPQQESPLQEAAEPVAPATGPGDEDYTAFEQRVLRAVGELPADQRDALLLREQGFSLADISAITGAASETVKSRLRYGRTQLRAQLGDSL